MRLAALTALILPLAITAPTLACANECSELWFSRNALYKRAGYCFRTARGIAAFGNAGCQYDDMNEVPLSERDRAAVAQYVREEAVLGCRS